MNPLRPSFRRILGAIEIIVQSALLALALASLLHHSSDDGELHRALKSVMAVECAWLLIRGVRRGYLGKSVAGLHEAVNRDGMLTSGWLERIAVVIGLLALAVVGFSA